ncbi:tyrosine-type recombinase/integrase [Roseomonas xinghualingensis]|uniref:tyrosine-type recombinase/integrase n=1 Tax=Roseomonas xinghualingensis TaxID=2986475 RepID=UPI0021F1935B|nr:integrase arm-type DNA-binding domain-containing protein [Roseomonas sp. SXEYE001]MCV4207156.1 integrase arm-type DNA-binding domain-containing protein [Roseomonas sp. SXEYE001]
MKLTDKAIRAAQAKEKPYRLADGGGLHLVVSPAGGRLWRYRYEMKGTERQLALGSYPSISLAEARRARDAARALLDKGLDPSTEKRTQRAQAAVEAATTFETVARAWYEIRRSTWSATHARDVERNLETDVFPALGSLPIKAIKPRMVLDMLRQVEARSLTTARKIRQQVSAVFVYAIAEDLAEIDPAQMIGGALRPTGETEHHAALTDPADLRAMLAKVDTQPAFPASRIALRLLALTAVRSKELRGARPEEFEGLDGPEPIWRIPKERMKGRKGKKREHLVPLAPAAVKLVQLAMTFAGKGRPLFPSSRSSQCQLSENALNRMLHRAGYEGRHTPHGFRSSFSTIMNERHQNEHDRAVIDLMLAHKPENAVEAAYNRAAYMKRKRELAEEWAALITEGLSPAQDLLALPRSGMGRPAKPI